MKASIRAKPPGNELQSRGEGRRGGEARKRGSANIVACQYRRMCDCVIVSVIVRVRVRLRVSESVSVSVSVSAIYSIAK